MLLKDVLDCSTAAVRGLDEQLIFALNELQTGLLTRVDDIPNLKLGEAVHPWLQSAAKPGLEAAIAARGETLLINSAYRTLAGQQLLRNHYEMGECDISAAAYPGKSNHNNASAIDVEDSDGWRSYLEANGFNWLGAFDAMHYDCVADGIENIVKLSVRAFQRLWSRANPNDKLDEDGDFGAATASRLTISPVEGFKDVSPSRILRLTHPIQMGTDVGSLQLALRKVGIEVKADQVFSQDTHNAVTKYQSMAGLVPDGMLGKATKKSLGLI